MPRILEFLDLGGHHGIRGEFRQIPFIDIPDNYPVVLGRDFLELGLVLVVPGAHVLALLLGVVPGVSNGGLPAIPHLDVLRDVLLVEHLSVTLDHNELRILLFACLDCGQVAALYQCFIKPVEKSHWHVL